MTTGLSRETAPDATAQQALQNRRRTRPYPVDADNDEVERRQARPPRARFGGIPWKDGVSPAKAGRGAQPAGSTIAKDPSESLRSRLDAVAFRDDRGLFDRDPPEPASAAPAAPVEEPHPVVGEPAGRPPTAESRFWRIDDMAWAEAPAPSRRRRRRGREVFVLGGLVVLIAGGAYTFRQGLPGPFDTAVLSPVEAAQAATPAALPAATATAPTAGGTTTLAMGLPARPAATTLAPLPANDRVVTRTFVAPETTPGQPPPPAAPTLALMDPMEPKPADPLAAMNPPAPGPRVTTTPLPVNPAPAPEPLVAALPPTPAPEPAAVAAREEPRAPVVAEPDPPRRVVAPVAVAAVPPAERPTAAAPGRATAVRPPVTRDAMTDLLPPRDDVAAAAARAPEAPRPPGLLVRIFGEPLRPAAPAPTATANRHVNMRSGPDKDAGVVSVVAPGTPVSIVSCNFWCEVTVDGRTGSIYQDYLDRPAAAAAR